MASTATRRLLRRVRLGRRHTYRALRRNRAATVIAAVVVATAIGTGVFANGDPPRNWEGPGTAVHLHSIPDGTPDRMGTHRN